MSGVGKGAGSCPIFLLEMPSWIAVLGSILLLGCAQARGGYQPARVEPSLRQRLIAHPDSTVGVLLRLTRNVQKEDSAYLVRNGFVLGSAQGRIVTGSAPAKVLRRLSAWPRMEWMEMSATVPMTPREPDVRAARPERQR